MEIKKFKIKELQEMIYKIVVLLLLAIIAFQLGSISKSLKSIDINSEGIYDRFVSNKRMRWLPIQVEIR
jgi:hypothetical protein